MLQNKKSRSTGKSKIALLVLMIFAVFTVSTFGNDLPTTTELKNREGVVKSLLMGIKSDNYGLRTSAAYMVGELKISEAVIPLLRMLRDESSEEARIMAAVALFKIADARGIYAIKQAIRFDDSLRVSKMCEKIYNCYYYEKNSHELVLTAAGF